MGDSLKNRCLVLIRHAKSSWDDSGLTDFERPLNKRGRHDAPLMGGILREHGFFPDLIVSSPAERALKTARLIAEAMAVPDAAIRENQAVYGADVRQLIGIVRRLDDDKYRIFLVAHNPGITHLAGTLTGLPVEPMPTCGVAVLEFRIPRWADVMEGRGVMIFQDFPRAHA